MNNIKYNNEIKDVIFTFFSCEDCVNTENSLHIKDLDSPKNYQLTKIEKLIEDKKPYMCADGDIIYV